VEFVYEAVPKSYDDVMWLNFASYPVAVNLLNPMILLSLEACLEILFHSTNEYLLWILLNLQNIFKSFSFDLQLHMKKLQGAKSAE